MADPGAVTGPHPTSGQPVSHSGQPQQSDPLALSTQPLSQPSPQPSSDPLAPPQQPYTPSGLTAADLVFTPPGKQRKGGAWKAAGAIAGVLALLLGAAAGGYFFRDMQGDDQPSDEPTVTMRTASQVQNTLNSDGFDCAEAFTEPVRVDLCFRDSEQYREDVGFQLLGADRISWLKIRVESRDAEQHPVKEQALRVFGTVLDEALAVDDAKPAKEWLDGNLPTDYTKSDYLVHEVGSVRLQLLPREQEMALLWVRLTAATYQNLGEETLPRVTAGSLETEHSDAGYDCKPSEGSVSCKRDVDAGEMVSAYGVEQDKVTAIRLTGTPTGKLEEIAPTLQKRTATLIGLMLADQKLDRARKWITSAFDGKPRHTVLSGLDVRINPVVLRGEGRAYYQVDLRPADW